jgi:hypothetical protein
MGVRPLSTSSWAMKQLFHIFYIFPFDFLQYILTTMVSDMIDKTLSIVFGYKRVLLYYDEECANEGDRRLTYEAFIRRI